MKNFASKEAQKKVTTVLQHLKSTLGEKNTFSLTLKDINAYYEFSKECGEESRQVIHKQLGDELFLCNLAVGCITSVSLSIPKDNSEITFFPSSWFDEKFPNPNFILRSHLIQIANFSLSIIKLVEIGLDNPARALLRACYELIWQTLVILTDKDILCKQSQLRSGKETTENWYKLFAKGKLNKRLAKIETDLGYPPEVVEEMKLWRKENQQFLSEAIHHSTFATNYGAFTRDFTDEENMNCNVMGAPSRASAFTIECLNSELCYFITLFFSIIDNRENIKTDPNDSAWFYANVLDECSIELFTWLYGKKNV